MSMATMTDTQSPALHVADGHDLIPEHARALLEAARGDRLEALYVLAIHTGMRQGELLALRWEDVDLEAGVLRVRGTKTARSRRTVKLSQTALVHNQATSRGMDRCSLCGQPKTRLEFSWTLL
jgi:site-specific recombinase XerD